MASRTNEPNPNGTVPLFASITVAHLVASPCRHSLYDLYRKVLLIPNMMATSSAITQAAFPQIESGLCLHHVCA